MGAAGLGLKGLVLDSSAVIAAERNRQPVSNFIEAIFVDHGPLRLSLSPVTVAELVHGIYRAQTQAAAERRRGFIVELIKFVPVHPATQQTGWLVGKIEGEEAAKGNVLPFNDLMVAVAAIEQSYDVLTRNLRHFQKSLGSKLFLSRHGGAEQKRLCLCVANFKASGARSRPIFAQTKPLTFITQHPSL